MIEQNDRLPLFPVDTGVNGRGRLVIGGCDTADLAAEYGTPLYIFDEATLRDKIDEFKTEFGQRYHETAVLYACKAFTNRALLRLVAEEGVGLDVVSGGEITMASSAGFPMDRVSFPGNNKSADELRLALELGVGRIVVDNFDELRMLGELTRAEGKRPHILLRVSPGVDPHTHRYEVTGSLDSKFGFPMAHAAEAVSTALRMPGVHVAGLHLHIGSQITETGPYRQAIVIILDFAARMSDKYGLQLNELSIGGGFPVQYVLDEPVPPVSAYAECFASTVKDKCREHGLSLPRLVIEPGRSLVARAGVALYTVGVIKDIPDVRTYVSVDGGMADNVRPALYQSKMEAVVANRMVERTSGKYTICGKFCESGDVLIWDIEMPRMSAGDLIAVPGSGAYNIPQSCNYNAFCRPAVVMVRHGEATMIRRRETIEDLMACEVD